MRICFVVGEIFNWDRYGGYGALTRTLGSHLVKKGLEVFVLTNKFSPNQRTIENLDGMTVIGLSSWHNFFLLKVCNADICHSEAPSFYSYVVQMTAPNKKHIVTFQDPMYIEEQIDSIWSFIPEWNSLSFRMKMRLKLRFARFLSKKAVKNSDALFTQAKYIIPKVMSMYHLKRPPRFLPNPVAIPRRNLKKADEPTVCFLARWDPVKRVNLFFELAKVFPDVKFIAMGKAHDESKDEYLRNKYGGISNLEMPGFVSEEEKSRILEKSWILINTSIRECLPVSFLEAASHKCAILSSNNPDNFAKDFGYHVTNGNYAEGLKFLLKDDGWIEKGLTGRQYVEEVHGLNKVIDQHIEVYRELLET